MKEIEGITEGAYSTHQYKGRLMIVDYYKDSNTWQCVDGGMIVRGRGESYKEAVSAAHKQWDDFKE